MIQVQGSHVYVDIEIDGQRLSEDFVEQNSIEIFAFRIALTAGFALPLFSMIMGSTNLAYLNKFKEINKHISSLKKNHKIAKKGTKRKYLVCKV